MNKISKIIRDVVLHSKYCLPGESRLAMINRNKNMHITKFPSLKIEIDNAYKFVLNDQVLPSMRSLQYGGREIELSNNKIYNCAFRAIDDLDAFGEIMYLLLGGTGVGVSVQYQHVSKLPVLRGKLSSICASELYVVPNNSVGWACAIDAAISQYYCGPTLLFDYSSLTNCKPLQTCIKNIERVFDSVKGQMKPIDYHDVICFIAQASTERAALISLFSENDNDMINAKSGEWWKTNPQRSLSNNSIMLDRRNLTRERFDELWKIVSLNKYGEPGFYFANDLNNGTNPCAEITLKSKQFCNLVEINVASASTQDELNSRSRAASFIATLQSSYTDFSYLSSGWKSTTEEDALIGVSMTGISAHAFCNDKFRFDLKAAATVVVNENIRVSKMIGTKPSPRCTTIKPAGSTSIIFGTSSGIHSYHSPYYIRRVRIMKNEELYKFLIKKFPTCIEASDFMNDNMGVIKFPMSSPNGAIMRSESVFDIMNRIKHFSMEWIKNGQSVSVDANSVSATISIGNDDWIKVGEWMWNNRDHYNGLSILPFDDHEYKQAPFTACSFDEYCKLCREWDGFEIDHVTKKVVNFENEPACAGGKCEM